MGVSCVSLPEQPGAFQPSACRSSALFTRLVYLNVGSLQVIIRRRMANDEPVRIAGAERSVNEDYAFGHSIGSPLPVSSLRRAAPHR